MTEVLFAVDGNFANQVTSLFGSRPTQLQSWPFWDPLVGRLPQGGPVGLCQSSHGIGGLLIVELVQGAQGFPPQLQITHGVIALHGLVEVGVLRIEADSAIGYIGDALRLRVWEDKQEDERDNDGRNKMDYMRFQSKNVRMSRSKLFSEAALQLPACKTNLTQMISGYTQMLSMVRAEISETDLFCKDHLIEAKTCRLINTGTLIFSLSATVNAGFPLG